jgi:hypothetical protein
MYLDTTDASLAATRLGHGRGTMARYADCLTPSRVDHVARMINAALPIAGSIVGFAAVLFVLICQRSIH